MQLPKVGTRVKFNQKGADYLRMPFGQEGVIISHDKHSFNVKWDDGSSGCTTGWREDSCEYLDYLDECPATLRSGETPKPFDCKCGIYRADCTYHKD